MADPIDVVIVGAGHNALVAATLLARAGLSVRVLERGARAGGAAISGRVFPGVDARLSKYSYLVSLFPRELREELGLGVELRERPGPERRSAELRGWQERMAVLAGRVAPTLTRPLLSREEFRAVVGDDRLWEDVFERPLGEALERELSDDTERGIVLTDATIGTFAPAHDRELRQNRCFLYHVIGDGRGDWRVPVGGMGAITDALVQAARAAGARIETGVEVTAWDSDGSTAEVRCADGTGHAARHVLLNAALTVAGGGASRSPSPEGSQLKINMLLTRLPRLRDAGTDPERAFAGTFHVNEGYAQMQVAYEEAAVGFVPSVAPCELYCHSLIDPTILGPELRAAGAQTLTLFGLHMPARLFGGDHDAAKRAAVEATMASLNGVLAEPVEDLLWRDAAGEPCLEALTPVELEQELGLPGGHIFHRDLRWPFAESEAEVGRWGVETDQPNVWLCGAGARRGGGVSGIPGLCAARAVLEARAGPGAGTRPT